MQLDSCLPPPPQPSPQAGEGAHRVCRAVIGPKWPRHRRKSRSGIGQTAHRFAGRNLLRQRRASALDCASLRRISPPSQARTAEKDMDAPPDRPSSEEPTKPASEVSDASDASASDTPPEASEAAAAPEAPAASDAPPPRSAVSWLGFATAAIGLVLAAVGIAALFMSRDNGVSALDVRLAGAERVVRELASRAPPAAADPKALEELTRRVAKLEATPQSSASDPALAARIAALEAEIKAMAATLGSVGRRDEEVLAVARDARARADASAAALSALEALANRVTAVERSEKAVESGDRA